MTDGELAANPRFANVTLGRFDRGMVLSDAEYQLVVEFIGSEGVVPQESLRSRLGLVRHLYLSDGAQWEERPGRAARNAMLSELVGALDSFIGAAPDISLLELLIPPANEPVRSMRYMAYGAFQKRLDQISWTRPLSRADGMDPDTEEVAGDCYRVLAEAAGHLSGILFNCDASSEGEMLERLACINDAALSSLSDVVDYARRLRTAAFEARAESIAHRGPEKPPALDGAVMGLIAILERHGIRVTHTPRKKDDYTGEPNSATGKIMFQFMRMVDPTILSTEISTALASAIAQRNKTSPQHSAVAQTI